MFSFSENLQFKGTGGESGSKHCDGSRVSEDLVRVGDRGHVPFFCSCDHEFTSSFGGEKRIDMASIALPIQSIERRMRGGAQALLVRDTEGNAYVAKCVGNPQGTRTLINEWIVGRLLRHLQVSTPEVRALQIERGVPGDHLLNFQVGSKTIPIANGLHFGSRCPVDPDRKAIFDFLPRRLLHQIVNLPDLIMAFVFDRWVNQADTRQAIFIRERGGGQTGILRAYLIDHGLSFGGSRWELSETPLCGLYFDRSIYERPTTEMECHSAVDRIKNLTEETLLSIEQEIPSEWLQRGDREEMTRLLALLAGRRTKLHDSIDRALLELQESRFLIAKNSDAKRLLSIIILLGALQRSSSNGRVTDDYKAMPQQEGREVPVIVLFAGATP